MWELTDQRVDAVRVIVDILGQDSIRKRGRVRGDETAEVLGDVVGRAVVEAGMLADFWGGAGTGGQEAEEGEVAAHLCWDCEREVSGEAVVRRKRASGW